MKFRAMALKAAIRQMSEKKWYDHGIIPQDLHHLVPKEDLALLRQCHCVDFALMEDALKHETARILANLVAKLETPCIP